MINLSSKLKKKLSSMKVGIVYLFGSQIMGGKQRKNDFDIGLVFTYKPERKDSLSLYFRLYHIFAQEFPKENIDISLLQFTPLDFQFEVIKSGRVLFEIEPKFRMDYEEITIRDYLFFAPLMNEYKKITTEAFS